MPVGTERCSVSQLGLMSLDQKIVPLCCAPRLAVASKDERTLLHILPHAVVKRSGMKQRVSVKEFRARADMEIRAAR